MPRAEHPALGLIRGLSRSTTIYLGQAHPPPRSALGKWSLLGHGSADRLNKKDRQAALEVYEPPSSIDRHVKREAAMSTEAELKAELERLKSENESLKARGSKGVSMKVSEKGGVSIYGLGRFPVTLYQEQWVKLLDLADDIRAFIKEHESQLKKKG